ncbi:hypothetical protein [Gilliamella sp. Fer1-1]|nr:hypothetical protein [Gilliamella apicola]
MKRALADGLLESGKTIILVEKEVRLIHAFGRGHYLSWLYSG